MYIPYVSETMGRPVVPGGAGGAMASPDFGRSVNPISTMERGRLYPPNNTGTPWFSDLPTALQWILQQPLILRSHVWVSISFLLFHWQDFLKHVKKMLENCRSSKYLSHTMVQLNNIGRCLNFVSFYSIEPRKFDCHIKQWSKRGSMEQSRKLHPCT